MCIRDRYVPETLIPALLDLEREYAALASDKEFQVRTRPVRHFQPQMNAGSLVDARATSGARA